MSENKASQQYDMAAYGMGYLSRQNGDSFKNNPFHSKTVLGISWMAGWSERDEIESDNNIEDK